MSIFKVLRLAGGVRASLVGALQEGCILQQPQFMLKTQTSLVFFSTQGINPSPARLGVVHRSLQLAPGTHTMTRMMCSAVSTAGNDGGFNAVVELAEAKRKLCKAEDELDAAKNAVPVDAQLVAKAELGVAEAKLGVAEAKWQVFFAARAHNTCMLIDTKQC